MAGTHSGLDNKLTKLRKYLKRLDSAVIAFSGGIDSTFLAHMAKKIMGEKALAVTVISKLVTGAEKQWAIKMARKLKIRHISRTLALPLEVINNSTQRCYYCKKTIFSFLKHFAKKKGYNTVLEGSNFDDLKDFRPGKRALKELKILKPLQEARLTKTEIRLLSRREGLAAWNKPSSPCLATRFPYGEKITPEKLNLIAETEFFLNKLGFSQVRLRMHGDIGRIEVNKEKIPLLLKNSSTIIKKLKSLGLKFICLDMEGFRSGSMNGAIQWKRRR